MLVQRGSGCGPCSKIGREDVANALSAAALAVTVYCAAVTLINIKNTGSPNGPSIQGIIHTTESAAGGLIYGGVVAAFAKFLANKRFSVKKIDNCVAALLNFEGDSGELRQRLHDNQLQVGQYGIAKKNGTTYLIRNNDTSVSYWQLRSHAAYNTAARNQLIQKINDPERAKIDLSPADFKRSFTNYTGHDIVKCCCMNLNRNLIIANVVVGALLFGVATGLATHFDLHAAGFGAAAGACVGLVVGLSMSGVANLLLKAMDCCLPPPNDGADQPLLQQGRELV